MHVELFQPLHTGGVLTRVLMSCGCGSHDPNMLLKYTCPARPTTCHTQCRTQDSREVSGASECRRDLEQSDCYNKLTACGVVKRPSGTGAFNCLCLLSFWLTVPPIHKVLCAPSKAGCLDPGPSEPSNPFTTCLYSTWCRESAKKLHMRTAAMQSKFQAGHA